MKHTDSAQWSNLQTGFKFALTRGQEKLKTLDRDPKVQKLQNKIVLCEKRSKGLLKL